MNSLPSEELIKQSLIAAAEAHHEFQENYLSGVRHEQWALWYAAFVIGKHGDFISPTKLTRLLEEVTDQEHWFRTAAKHISENIANG